MWTNEPDDIVKLGIEELGTQRQKMVPFKA